jgi:hypothetical protein
MANTRSWHTYIVIWFKLTRQVIIIELTVPWEVRIEEANERKRLKYQMIAECTEREWKTWIMPVEVCCRGSVGQSLWRMAKTLGVPSRRLGKKAEAAFMWIWRERKNR